uniref:NAC domain-containing protein n=1 Tax=Leersia perrieri TaxID=77586 RepID=A0A0D9VP76_9ORYZ
MATVAMELEQDLPGFRFHPTEEELLDFYLARVVLGKKLQFDIIGTLNIYRHDPWDLPGMAKIGEREWYFFVPRDRKAGNGGRPNRTTERGFWKATGSDRAIRSSGDPKRVIGLKKTLVFYQGRAPRGTKTDWVMNEYRLPDFAAGRAAPPFPKEDMVLCKIYRKATPLKELEQRASAMEEMQRRSSHGDHTNIASIVHDASASTGDDYFSSDDVHDSGFLIPSSSSSAAAAAAPSDSSKNGGAPREAKKEEEADVTVTVASATSAASLSGLQLPSLQLPANHGVMDWLQDPFLTQLRSPWQDQHCLSPYAHLLYY